MAPVGGRSSMSSTGFRTTTPAFFNIRVEPAVVTAVDGWD
jgi:hypothetical protein